MTTGTILIGDDDTSIRTILGQALSRAGYDVRTSATASGLWRWIEAGEGDLVIADVLMPDGNGFDLLPRIKKHRQNLPVVIMSAQNTFLTAIKASERGAYEYLPKPFDLKEVVAIVARALSERRKQPGEHQSRDLDNIPLIGRSPAMQEIYRIVARLVQTDVTVTVTGESGTGKELVARALHDYGKRKRGPFVAVNMAAIPRDLIESELFGHEKGSFTGANSRAIGRFEQAEGGTLFLDEIGDMPMEAQTRLLRVLQQGEYTTIGGRLPLKTNVRIIAATNKQLRPLIQQGLFREDLFFRLNVVPLRLPALRERLEDIGDLVRHFFARTIQEGLPFKQMDGLAIERLKSYHWPGNVRELENFVRRLIVLYPQEVFDASLIDMELENLRYPDSKVEGSQTLDLSNLHHHLHHVIENYTLEMINRPTDGTALTGLYQRLVQEVEVPLLGVVLKATRGNQIKAAEILGLNRNTLRKKLRELNLHSPFILVPNCADAETSEP